MEANVSLGRCEGDSPEGPFAQCTNEAVRMVTVREPVRDYINGEPFPVPMCEACAAYHEARQKERSHA